MNYFDKTTRNAALCLTIGLFFWQQAQRNLALTDIRTAAKGLRKRGVPVELSVKLLCTKGIV